MGDTNQAAEPIGGEGAPLPPPSPSAENVTGDRVVQGTVIPSPVTVSIQPTQVRRPWRTTARTVFQALVALAILFPVLVEQTGLDPEDAPWLAIPLAVAGAVARIMALPQVEVFLRRFVPFLSATPKETRR